ncbi:hypothetical protein [Natronobiforma cellulositropha]|uniref:hypothetical protein n=1 Tax=Natronobiforma cellulositropha TaxID=1679076 RepID=UPI0021D56C6B|nr:hypothetical protein [Natronobiforma cellulositropha]
MVDLTRRQVLAAGGGVAALGSGRAVYNVFLGYDRFTGTNLRRQDLDPLVANGLRPSERHVATVDGYRIEHHDWTVSVRERGADDPVATFALSRADRERAAAVDADLGLTDGPLEQLVSDLRALAAGEVRFVYDSYPDFFEYARSGETRPYTVAAVRGYREADPDLIAAFAGADPRDPEALAEGLVEGFREHTNYDVGRYVAGSVEDNVLFGARDLRGHFESPTDFEALLAGEDGGLFCYELARRSVDAFQAVSALEQSPPVVGGFVLDERHKHVYTILVSFLREDGDLVVPVTFLDYTHSTLYDDLRLRRVLGEGLDAYDTRHRVTAVGWYQ